jgi:hypothetical protein
MVLAYDADGNFREQLRPGIYLPGAGLVRLAAEPFFAPAGQVAAIKKI